MTKLEKLRFLLQWVEDLRSGEMIEAPQYTKHFMSFPVNFIKEGELDWLCKVTNYILKEEGKSKVRVVNRAGEIIPAKER